MEPIPLVHPLIVITGPTASGKTGIAIELAKKFNGEIICADSRTIYRGMDIGTAKPTKYERALVPHWGLDIVEPGDYFSVVDFQQYAVKKIQEIRGRGHIPFLVGGTGLYIDSVIFDYKFGPPVDKILRSKLQRMEIEELQTFCLDKKIKLPENKKNKRYLIRAIERDGLELIDRKKTLNNIIVVGIATDKDILMSRIRQRAVQIFKDGVVEEARILGLNYGWENEAMKSNIYPLIHKYIEGAMSVDEVQDKFITLDWRLAKRQMTWMRRNKFIRWSQLNDVQKFIIDQLAISE